MLKILFTTLFDSSVVYTKSLLIFFSVLNSLISVLNVAI